MKIIIRKEIEPDFIPFNDGDKPAEFAVYLITKASDGSDAEILLERPQTQLQADYYATGVVRGMALARAALLDLPKNYSVEIERK